MNHLNLIKSNPLGGLKSSYRERYTNFIPQKPEHIARERRLEAFEKIGNLKEVLCDSESHRNILDQIPLMFRDHTSFWLFKGTPMVMVETYRGTVSDISSTSLTVIEVPEQIAPYGGIWDPAPGAKSSTRSFLCFRPVGKRKAQTAEELLKKLARQMRPWNASEDE